MKKKISIIIFIVFWMLVFTGKMVGQEPATEEIVGSGCIGDCKVPSNFEYTVTGKCNVEMIARAVDTSLCPNMGVYAFLFKNGKEVANGHFRKKGKSLITQAAPGDKIIVYIMTYPLFNNIKCIRQGSLKFNLIKKNIVKKDC